MSEQEINKPNVPESCPHCGEKLSPWQQVLLSVDRMITCRNCWYKIILDVFEAEQKPQDENKKNEERK